MISIFKELLSFVHFSKTRIALIILFNIIEAVLSVFGVALLFPLITYLQIGHEEFVAQMPNGMLHYLKTILDFFNLEVSLGLLILTAFVPLLFKQCVTYFKEVQAIKLQQNAIYQIRHKLLNALLCADIAFYTKTKLGDIANVFTMTVLRSGLLIQYLISYWGFIFIGLIYSVLLVMISFKLTITTIASLIAIPFLMHKQTNALRNRGKKVETTNAELYSYLVDKFRNIKKIFLFNMQKMERCKFSCIAHNIEKVVVKTLKINALINALLEPIFFLAVLMIIFIGVKFLNIEFSVLFIFLYALSRLNPQIKGAVKSRNQSLVYHRSFGRVNELYEDALKATTIVNGNQIFQGLAKNIRFDNVHFSYDKNNPLFQGISFNIEKNKTTAIVGRSGSGKSAVVDLLLRFRDVDNGNIHINDIDIRNLDITSYREKIGVVTQDIMLFNGTIMENIMYGLNEVTDEQLQQTLRMSHVDEFVEQLENKLDSFIGEAGTELSGGQRQRLTLAHMFLRKPEIMVLDEPTSALDSESENVIKNAIKELKGKVTLVIIAHRLSTIKNSDNIIVMDNGSVVSQGTYNELINKCKYFRRLAELQKL